MPEFMKKYPITPLEEGFMSESADNFPSKALVNAIFIPQLPS
jgi:hypothetical protein